MSQTPPNPPVRKRRSKLKRWLLGIGITVLALFVAILIFVPVVAGSDWAKNYAVESIEENLNGDVTIDGLEFSWGSGVVVRGLEVANPSGFPSGPALRVERTNAGVSLRSLLTFSIKAKVVVDKPEVFVHVRKDGKINLLALEKKSADDSTDKPGDGPGEPKPFDAQVSLRVRDGSVEILDESRGLAQRVQKLQVDVANDDFGGPMRFALDAELAQKGKDKSGELSATGKVDLNRDQPLDFFAFETTGLQLADYGPLVEAMLPEQRFDAFRGAIAGKLSARPVENTEEFAITGDLTIENFDVRGGPMGPGRGLVGSEWKIRPNMKIDPTNMTGSIDGTDIDLGFATVRALPPSEARELMQDANASGALGLVVDIDLKKLGAQPLLPKGEYSGKLRMRLSAVPPPKGTKALPWGVDVAATEVRVSGDFLERPVRLDTPLVVDSQGRVDLGSERPAANGKFRVRGAGLDGQGAFQVQNEYAAKLALDVMSTELATLIGGWLPPGLKLDGPGKVRADIRGTLPRDSATGGLLASDLPTVDADIEVPVISWFGSKLAGLKQRVNLANGKLAITTPEGATLNAGPLSLSLDLQDLLGEQPRVDFDIGWKGGKTNGAMTPALQYVVPLLAGLPTRDLNSLTGIQFDATAGFELKGGGPLPTSADAIAKALEGWNASGNMRLQNGSFSPSPALGQLFRFFQDKSKISFKEIKSKIRIKDGKVWTSGFELGGSDGIVRLAGSTTLAGALDVKIDMKDLLSKHSDGRKVLKVLGGQLSTNLTGTLWQPTLDLAATFENALQKAVQNTIQDAAKGALDDLLKGKKPKIKDLLKGIGK